MAGNKLLVYLLRRDLRTIDNPILHHLATSDHGFTHLLPIYILPPQQIETSGFVVEGQKSPYPEARSQVGRFWRCGSIRAKFQAECIWDLKQNLEKINSGMLVRIGKFDDVLNHLIKSLHENNQSIDTVWMTEEPSKEEVDDQNAAASVCSENGINFKLWLDEKYFIDDRDTGLSNPNELPDVFTTYRKTQEPLRERPRPTVPRPQVGSLPSFPSWALPQQPPFQIPDNYDEFERRLVEPVKETLSDPPSFPEGAKSAHPFKGGENPAWERLYHLIKSGAMTTYQETRNGLLGLDYSTKLAAFLAMGCMSARSIHEELVKFESGSEQDYSQAMGFGGGENEGTRAVRFELLWRDYMRLCTMKFGAKLFSIHGFKGKGNYSQEWKTANKEEAAKDQDPPPDEVAQIIDRLLRGTTGQGLIDASQRELLLTGYTSNRARQNVASFAAKHLSLSWLYMAEWYEQNLVDYDVSSNWSNWQYVAGVGNDPRGQARQFNPVKQAFDYDNDGRYVRTWVTETRGIQDLQNVFQLSTTSAAELEKNGIADNIMVTNPLKRIEFSVDRKPRGPRRPYRWRRGGRGGRGGGSRDGDARSNGRGGTHHNDSENRTASYHQQPPGKDFYNQGSHFNNGQTNYSRDYGQPRRGNAATPWRGNSNIHSFRGNFQQGYNNNAFNPPHYMSNANYHHQFPQTYHHQLPPHMQ
ncbi:uncharacterized protein FIESC28_08756 [Fusarium coffeatum]|uniref:Cryptochrome DASH n=1 Tax=Fusarium coffeatum TaxID=231269 RepID=A0A366R5B8_9HYPO|nr:uncharacterized protein FIESC28_08756 [Fusarium coffeatum]RBR12122.1 hypothetical protein FIESC28_08756 [Fusarium coffeatum]